MLEIYEIVWRNKDVTGYLEYNTKTDKFQAYLKDRENPKPERSVWNFENIRCCRG